MTAHSPTIPRAPCSYSERAYVRLQCAEAKVLLFLAEDCSESSYVAPALLIRRLGGSVAWAWMALRRLEALGRVEGSWRVGWRLTAAGWEMQGGSR